MDQKIEKAEEKFRNMLENKLEAKVLMDMMDPK